MLEGITKSSEKYKITAGLVLTVSRGPMATLHLQQLLDAYTALGMPRAVVGLDLAGHEDVESSEDLGHQFRDAKDRYGFGITIHAGETGSSTRVWEALEEFSADRIGHGVAAILDPALLDALRERDICLELCPTSNLLTNAEAGFPNRAVISLIQFEVPFVLCSDNPGIQNNSINNDYQLFLDATNRNDILLKMYEQQQKYTFLNNK